MSKPLYGPRLLTARKWVQTVGTRWEHPRYGEMDVQRAQAIEEDLDRARARVRVRPGGWEVGQVWTSNGGRFGVLSAGSNLYSTAIEADGSLSAAWDSLINLSGYSSTSVTYEFVGMYADLYGGQS